MRQQSQRAIIAAIAAVSIALGTGCSAARPGSPVSTPLAYQAVPTSVPPTPRLALPAAAMRPADVTLLAVDTAPLISEAEALQIVRAKIPLPAMQTNDPVVAAYGLATFGRPGDAGKPWLGIQNMPLPTGEVLARIENCPMWLLDFSNIPGDISSHPDSGHNHVVYAVDAPTRSILLIWSYAGL